MDQVLLYFSLKYHGNWQAIYDALEAKERIDPNELEQVESWIDCDYLAITDEKYPETLKESYEPPFILFYKGDLKLLLRYYKTIGLVGESSISEYSLNQTKEILGKLCLANKTVVSLEPLSNLNLETCQHILISSALKGKDNLPNQLIISESYEQNLTTSRNRLLFATSNFLFINELGLKNPLFTSLKSLIGKVDEWFVLPQPNTTKNLANNWLIKQGAKLVEGPLDVLNDF